MNKETVSTQQHNSFESMGSMCKYLFPFIEFVYGFFILNLGSFINHG